MSITMIGLDTAKSVFQVHGVNETGRVAIRRKLRPIRALAASTDAAARVARCQRPQRHRRLATEPARTSTHVPMHLVANNDLTSPHSDRLLEGGNL